MVEENQETPNLEDEGEVDPQAPTAPDEPIEGADDLPDNVQDGDSSDDEEEESGEEES